MSSDLPSMPDKVRNWIQLAAYAPSGDNSQPWDVKLEANHDEIALFLSLNEATRRETSFFDYEFCASYLSLGAFAQNFELLASVEGFLINGVEEEEGRFVLKFSKTSESHKDPGEVAELIKRRRTDRSPYKRMPLPGDALHSLSAAAGKMHLHQYTGAKISEFAQLFTVLDRARYQNVQLYNEFLGKLRFGLENEQFRDGLRDKTLGVPLPSLWFLRLLRFLQPIRAVHILFFLGLERVMAFFGCKLLIQNSAAVFVLIGHEDTPLGWFKLGQTFQRIWLETTRYGFSLQPLGTTLFLYRLERSAARALPSGFSDRELAIFSHVARRMHAAFGLSFDRPLIAFRVGRGNAIGQTSLRRPVSIG